MSGLVDPWRPAPRRPGAFRRSPGPLGWVEEHGFGLLFGLVVALNLLPIWTVAWLPMQDLGGHMELMDVMARYGEPGTIYAKVFELPRAIGPNTLSLYAGWLLGPLLGTAVVTKLLLSFYVIGLPLSALSLCRAFDRSPWLAFLTVPLVFNSIVNVGFLNYLLAMPLLLWTIPLGMRLSREGGWRVWTLLALDLLALLLAHVIGWLIGAALAVFFAVLYLRRAADLVRLSVLAPSAPIFGVWFHRMFIALEPTEAGRTFGTGDGIGATFASFDARIIDFHTWGVRLFRDSTEEIVLVLIGLVWLVALALGQTRAREQAPPRDALGFARHHALELMTLLCVVAYFALPSNANEVAVLTERIVLMILFFLLLWPRLPLRGATAWVVAPAVAACVLYPFVVRAKFARFEAERVGDLPAAIAALPDGTRLAYRLADGHDPMVYHGPLWHIPKAIHALANGGVSHDSFALRPYTPIQYRPGETPPRMLPFIEGSDDLYRYDHFLLYSRDEPKRTLALEQLALRWHQSGWYLFDVHQPPDEGALTVVATAGRGGHQARWDCPDGQVMVGLAGSHRRWVQHLRAKCGRLAPGAVAGERVGPGAVSRRFGQPAEGLAAAAVSCPDDQVAVGLYGEVGTFLISVGLLCATLDDVRGGEQPLPVRRTARIGQGRPGDETFELRCPRGAVARGWRGREGAIVDAAGLACGEPVVQPTGKPAGKAGTSGKTGKTGKDGKAGKVGPAPKAGAPPKSRAVERREGPGRLRVPGRIMPQPGSARLGLRPAPAALGGVKAVREGIERKPDRLNRSPRRRVQQDEE